MDPLLIERRDALAVLTLNRPDKHNALSLDLLRRLHAALDALGEDAGVRCVVLRGNDRCFSTGMDLADLAGVSAVAETQRALSVFRDANAAVERCPKPVVCAIEKYAMGVGLELAMACDIRLATKDSVLALPEVTLGQIPGSGGSQRVARIAGLTRAVDMMMLGRRIPAPEAHAWGLVTRVVEDSAALDKEIDEVVGKLTSMSPLALKTIKRVLATAYETGIGVGLEVEGHAYEKLRQTEDYKEGIAAFSEKRKPKFKDRL